MEQSELDFVKKTSLVNSQGVKYTKFRASLKPKYHIVWAEIFAGYAIMIATLLLAGWAQNKYPGFFWLTIPLCAINVGYWFTYLHLFMHEASHYNIAPGKELNDKLANIFLGLVAGLDIKFYRVIHFEHHRHLGTTKDTENTYFEPLNWKFIIESVTGIRVLRVLGKRNNVIRAIEGLSPEILRNNKRMTILGAIFNLSVAVSMFAFGYWQPALVWLGGLGIVFPFFHSLRQLLEHRGEYAKADVNYFEVNHGEISRMFGTGPINSTLGSAGFNRHLLHHWDPQASYTRLKEIEEFLKDTEIGPKLEGVHTSYVTTFFKLFNK